MEHVAAHRGIDGTPTLGRTPDSRQLLYAATAWVAFGVGAVLEAREPRQRQMEAPRPSVAVQQRVEVTEQQLSKWMRAWNDDEFAPRQVASSEAMRELWEDFDTGQRDPNALLRRIKRDPQGRLRASSAEQEGRVDNLEQEVKRWETELPQALEKGRVLSGEKAFEKLRAKMSIPLGFDKNWEDFGDVRVDLRGEREERLVNNVLAQLCNATKTKPWRHNSGNLDLSAAKEDESVIWSKDLLGVVTVDADGNPEQVALQMEPGRGAILALIDGEGAFYDPCPRLPIPPQENQPVVRGPRLSIALPERPKWTGTVHYVQIHYDMLPTDPAHVDAIVADLPASVTLAVGGEARQLGPQEIKLLPPKELPHGGWQITCSSDIFAKLDWMSSDTAWDMLTYELADTNRYVMRDEKGEEMNIRIEGTDFQQRNMWVTIACPRKPASATVTAMTRFEARRLELPRLPITRPARPPAR